MIFIRNLNISSRFIKHNRNLAVLLSLVSILLRVLVKLGLNLQTYFQGSILYNLGDQEEEKSWE